MIYQKWDKQENLVKLSFVLLFFWSGSTCTAAETALFLSDHLKTMLFGTATQGFNHTPVDSPSCNRIRCSLTYANLYHHEKKMNDTLVGRGDMISPGLLTSCEYGSHGWRVNAFFERTVLDAEIQDLNEGYAVTAEQQLNVAGVDVWKLFSHGSAGVHVSRVLTDDVSDEDGFFTSRLMNYGISGRVRFGMFSASGSLHRCTDHLSVSGVHQLSDAGIRTFPLFLSNWRYCAGVAVRGRSGAVQLNGAVRYLSSQDVLSSRNAMPNNFKAIMRRGEVTGTKNINSIALTLRGWINAGGGYLEGYDSKAYNYMLMDSLTLKIIGMQLDVSGWYDLRAGVFGEQWNGQSPYGFISMAPFSSWTLFYPLKYRFLSMVLEYSEIGMFAEKNITLGNYHAIGAVVTGSRIYGKFQGVRQQRSIAVFIPYYTNTITFTTFHFKGALFSALVNYTVRVGKLSVTASVKQYVPFINNLTPEPDKPASTVGPETVTPREINKKTRGGTIFGLEVGFMF